MNGNTTNVILIKKCYQKGTLMKDAINIVFDLKNSLTLGNSVRLVTKCILSQESVGKR